MRWKASSADAAAVRHEAKAVIAFLRAFADLPPDVRQPTPWGLRTLADLRASLALARTRHQAAIRRNRLWAARIAAARGVASEAG